MKKFTLALGIVLASTTAYTQLPVSTTPQKRNVVIEEYTGINCGYCPQGHKIANQIKSSLGEDKVVLVNIHANFFAEPDTDQPDYRTNEGETLDLVFNNSSYPAATINRTEYNNKYAINRELWEQKAKEIIKENSYVNLAIEGDINVSSRTLTVTVEGYYTDNSPNNINYLTVGLVEDNVLGYQANAKSFYPEKVDTIGEYEHGHMLRKILTNTWGDSINTTTKGTKFTRTFTYQLPETHNDVVLQPGKLKLFAFIAQDSANIVTGVNDSFSLTSTNPNYSKADILNIEHADESCYGEFYILGSKVYNNSINNIDNITFTSDNTNVGSIKVDANIPPFSYKNVSIRQAITLSQTDTLKWEVAKINDYNVEPNSYNTNFKISNTPSNGLNLTFSFTQDAAGSESLWFILEESTRDIIAEGGPYKDYEKDGYYIDTTVTHKVDFKVEENKCYEIFVLDYYGDGINDGIGEGHFELLSGTDTIIKSDGNFGVIFTDFFKGTKANSIVNIDEITQLKVYPNPAYADIKLEFNNPTTQKIKWSLVDLSGRKIVGNEEVVSAGYNKIIITNQNIPSGLYNLVIDFNDLGKATKKISVIK